MSIAESFSATLEEKRGSRDHEPTRLPLSGPWLHRFASGLAFLVVFLIAAGANVTSREAGLAVPDWPLSYGTLNPPRWWQIDNVRAEHGHRLLAGTVAILTVLLAVWAHRREPRRWVRRLSLGAVAAVLLQALLGGLTVRFFLPTPISVSHAALAQVFLCLVVTLAVVTSETWQRVDGSGPRVRLGSIPQWAALTTGLVFLQIVVGAVMRHSGAGLAIPDFPRAFGRWVPPRFDFPIAIHYAHRLGALAVTLAVAVSVIWVLGKLKSTKALRLPVLGLTVLVPLQITLGASVVLTSKAIVPNTFHVATGAAILATSLVLTLHAWRMGNPSRMNPERSSLIEG